jgi:hypothetical protein
MNLQQHQLLMHHVGGGIVSPSILSNGSSGSASVAGSSSSRSHTLGNFANSSLSLMCDTKDNNGKTSWTINMQYYDQFSTFDSHINSERLGRADLNPCLARLLAEVLWLTVYQVASVTHCM